MWDVGHQTYAHKILTGRREAMARLRQAGGPSGFPRRVESEYDTFGTAHSSTSISAALGMAVAARLKGEDRRAIAVIGDGAMTAGMAFEALNNAGISGADLLVILNDNDMSISEPVGALDQYLAKVLSSRLYNTVRRSGKEMLAKLPPPVHELARRAEEHVKGMVLPGTLFEEFGFNYIGPIDGHDVDALVKTLANVRELKGPQFLHVVTQQGLRLSEGGGRSDPLSRRVEIRSGRRLQPEAVGQAELHAGVRRLAVRHGGAGTPASSASRRRCAKARGSCAFRRNFRSATSTSASRNSTR